jgi:hypothetical protein
MNEQEKAVEGKMQGAEMSAHVYLFYCCRRHLMKKPCCEYQLCWGQDTWDEKARPEPTFLLPENTFNELAPNKK